MLRNREHLCTVTNLFPLLLHGNGVDNIDDEIMYQNYTKLLSFDDDYGN